MATNLAGPVNLGELNACVVRGARLDADCSPTGGTNTGIVTAGLVTLTADPVIAAGTDFTQKNACGTVLYQYTEEDKITGYTMSGEFAFADFEMMAMFFGGATILGAVGGPFAGKVIGYSDPAYNAAPSNGCYLEVITTTLAQGAGNCISVSTPAPAAFGHIFPKVKLLPGSQNFANDLKRVAFTGKGTNNPSIFDGPWNDYPGAGYAPANSSHYVVGYSAAQYATILASVAIGLTDTPVGS